MKDKFQLVLRCLITAGIIGFLGSKIELSNPTMKEFNINSISSY